MVVSLGVNYFIYLIYIMILIIDKELSKRKLDILNEYASVYTIDVKEDHHKFIKSLPSVDIYIVNISRCKFMGRSYGIRWLEINQDCKMEKVYYRRTKMINKKNLDRLKCKVIKSFPSTVVSKDDLIKKLNIEAFPHTRGGIGFCLGYLANKITMRTCCVALCASC